MSQANIFKEKQGFGLDLKAITSIRITHIRPLERIQFTVLREKINVVNERLC